MPYDIPNFPVLPDELANLQLAEAATIVEELRGVAAEYMRGDISSVQEILDRTRGIAAAYQQSQLSGVVQDLQDVGLQIEIPVIAMPASRSAAAASPAADPPTLPSTLTTGTPLPPLPTPTPPVTLAPGGRGTCYRQALWDGTYRVQEIYSDGSNGVNMGAYLKQGQDVNDVLPSYQGSVWCIECYLGPGNIYPPPFCDSRYPYPAFNPANPPQQTVPQPPPVCPPPPADWCQQIQQCQQQINQLQQQIAALTPTPPTQPGPCPPGQEPNPSGICVPSGGGLPPGTPIGSPGTGGQVPPPEPVPPVPVPVPIPVGGTIVNQPRPGCQLVQICPDDEGTRMDMIGNFAAWLTGPSSKDYRDQIEPWMGDVFASLDSPDTLAKLATEILADIPRPPELYRSA
jgi:hypothetical protein